MFPAIPLTSKTIPPAELAALREKVDKFELTEARERYEGSLSEFVRGAWSSIDSAEYRESFVIDAMCDHLECVTMGYISRLLINVPPRASKTSVVSILYPAWVWARSEVSFWSGPQVKFLCASFDHGLALESSNKSRRLMMGLWFQKHWPGKIELHTDQNLKCLIRGLPVLMADGSLVAIENVKEGDNVLSYNLTLNKIVSDKVVNVWKNGVKPARRIVLSDGTVVTATLNHRFYGWDDWLYVGNMKVGDPLAVAEKTPSQTSKVALDDVFLLSLWLAEGSKSASSFAFTNTDPLILGRVARICEERGWAMNKYGDCTYLLTVSRNTPQESPRVILKEHIGSEIGGDGIRTRLVSQSCDNIRIPSSIMSGSDEVVLEFLSTYIACDGSVACGKNHGLFITTVSEEMARDFTILLKRFGVQCILGENESYYVVDGVRKRGRNAWTVRVCARKEIEKLSGLSLFSKDAKFRALLVWCSQKMRHTGSRCPTIPPHSLCNNRWSTKAVSVKRAIESGDCELAEKISGGLSWRKVRSIEDVGEVETWHLQTEKTSLFFAEGILSHNTNFGNTAGGVRVSTSVGSQILGRGGDILIADDLNKVKNDEVETADERNAVKDFWDEFSSTRLNDPKRSAIIAIQQRLHQRDNSGLILDGNEDYVHLMIPMRYDSSRHCVTVKLPQYDDDEPWEDPRGVIADEEGRDGQLMWPERFGEREVRALESKLGPFMAAGRLQQLPTPKGGGILKRDWWGYWDKTEAARYGLEWGEGRREFPIFDLVVASLDTAYKEKEQNDFNALTIWGIWLDKNKNRRAMLMYGWAKRLPLHGKVISAMLGEAKVNFKQRQEAEWGLVEWVASTCKHYKVTRLLIEDKSRGVDVANELNRLYARENFGVELVNPVGDKVSRAHSVVSMFTDDMIWAPAGPQSNGYFTKWAEEVITQCALFDKAEHDDLVDTVTQFLLWGRENGILVRADEMNAALEDEAMYHHKVPSVAENYGV